MIDNFYIAVLKTLNLIQSNFVYIFVFLLFSFYSNIKKPNVFKKVSVFAALIVFSFDFVLILPLSLVSIFQSTVGISLSIIISVILINSIIFFLVRETDKYLEITLYFAFFLNMILLFSTVFSLHQINFLKLNFHVFSFVLVPLLLITLYILNIKSRIWRLIYFLFAAIVIDKIIFYQSAVSDTNYSFPVFLISYLVLFLILTNYKDEIKSSNYLIASRVMVFLFIFEILMKALSSNSNIISVYHLISVTIIVYFNNRLMLKKEVKGFINNLLKMIVFIELVFLLPFKILEFLAERCLFVLTILSLISVLVLFKEKKSYRRLAVIVFFLILTGSSIISSLFMSLTNLSLFSFGITTVAVSIIYMLFLVILDYYERKPFGIILELIFAGFLSAVIALNIHNFVGSFTFLNLQDFVFIGEYFFSKIDSTLAFHISCAGFSLYTGLAEELAKMIVFFSFFYFSENNKQPYDNIFFAGFIALGFAFIENLIYGFNFGIETALQRNLLNGHILPGITMGYFAAKSKYAKSYFNKILNLIKAYFIPVILHFIWNYSFTAQDELSNNFYYFFSVLYISALFIAYLMIRETQKESPYKPSAA